MMIGEQSRRSCKQDRSCYSMFRIQKFRIMMSRPAASRRKALLPTKHHIAEPATNRGRRTGGALRSWAQAALRSREFVDSYHNKSSLTKKEFVDSPMTTAH